MKHPATRLPGCPPAAYPPLAWRLHHLPPVNVTKWDQKGGLMNFHRTALAFLACVALGSSAVLSAQVTMTGATAKCVDGTYSRARTKQGACSGHDGIARWYGPGGATATVAPAGATAKCGDGSYSKAHSRQGACSAHDGIAQWYGPGETERGRPAEAEPIRVSPGAPAGATARCEDGTYSKAKTHSGACATHGGVAKWMGGEPDVAPARDREAERDRDVTRDARGATALCNDGTYSQSQHRSGTCSYHKGVRRWLKEIPN